MSRSKRFLNGVVVGYTYQALVMVVGLWLTPFLLRHLGQQDYGLWLTALQIMTYLALADFGIVALLPRSVAYETGRAGGTANSSELASKLGQTAVIVLGQTPLVALAALLAWLFLPKEWLALRGPLAVIMGAYAVLFPLRIFSAVLEGLQEQAFVIRTNMVSWSIGTLSNVLLILAGFGLYAIAIGSLIQQSILAFTCAYRLWNRHREALPSHLPRLSKAELWGQLGRGFWISANQIGQVLMAGTDILIISKVLGPAMVVPYACTGKLANVLSNQPQMLMHLATPGLSEMKTGEPKERLYQVSVALSQGMLLVAGLLFCVISVINKPFVYWWVGSKQFAGFAVTILLLVQMLLRHWNLTFAYTAFSLGYEKRLAISGFFDGLITTGAMFALVGRFGYAGIVAGSIAGVCLSSLPTNVITVARDLSLPVSRLIAPFGPWFWRWGLIAGCSVVLGRTWVFASPLQMILAAALVSLVYIAALAGPILASPLGIYIRAATAGARQMFLKLWAAAPSTERMGP